MLRLTLHSAVGDHDHVVALHQTGPTEEESWRTHLASSAITLDWLTGICIWVNEGMCELSLIIVIMSERAHVPYIPEPSISDR
jgi:hypothetical protein